MGSEGDHEDDLFAKYIKNALENKPNDFSKIVEHLRNYMTANKFTE